MTAVEELYRERRTDLVRAAFLLLDDRGAAEEAVQEAFVRLHRAYPRLTRPGDAAGYLYRSVVNECRSQLRRRSTARRLPVAAVAGVSGRTGDRPGAETAAMASADRAVVLSALDRLPTRQRECIVLRWYLDLSERDIAEALGVSGGSVKTHLHRGLAALAEHLEVLR
jgi:RNA polymerase sigma-70 factor (sigma-E family)